MSENGLVKFVGRAQEIQRILKLVKVVATEDVTVLLRGETGVGKEILARKIHVQSPRSHKNFVTVNCPAITSEIAEAELFGHERGSFTGAHVSREGLLASADGGTVFFDEIGDMDMIVQLKLLRFLNDGSGTNREVRSVGSNTHKNVNVRVVAATNQNLPELVKKGRFRKDLYFRLNPFIIQIPPLRERKEDIPLLLEHFLGGFSISDDALKSLMAHDWPGNIRELRAVVDSAKIFARFNGHESIQAEDILFSEILNHD